MSDPSVSATRAKRRILVWVIAAPLVSALVLVPALVSAGRDTPEKGLGIGGRPAVAEPTLGHLLDRGDAGNDGGSALHGGGPPGPIPIAFPGAGPIDTASGFAAGVGAFGTATGAGVFAGNLLLPGMGYPPGFLTAGTVPGFDVTGIYAWHSPFLKTGSVSATPAGSTRRILAAAGVAAPGTPLAPAAVGPPGFAVVTVSTGLPGPTAVVGGPAIVSPPLPIVPAFPGVFCGLAIGGPGFIDAGWLANGVGAVIPPGPSPMPPPTRVGFPPTIFGTTGGGGLFPVSAISFSATPQTQIAGCFVAGATTPVELMAIGVD